MAVKTVVVTSDRAKARKVKFEDYDLVEVLGDSNDALGLRIDEVVRSISDSVRESITSESELAIEITGSVSLKGEAGAKWLFFNIGGSATESDTLKVTLTTKLSPARSSSE